jgi:hypothetical protein
MGTTLPSPRVEIETPTDKTESMDEQLSRTEIGKDALQETVESVASAVGEVTSIITTAVKDIAGAIGGVATDLFEIRDGIRQASEHTETD